MPDGRGLWSRLGWFVLLWLAGFLALTAVSLTIRWVLM